MSKNLQEAIESVGMVNNVDGQNFDKDFVGTAPVSYADAVLKMRAKREQAKKGCEEHTKTAMETLKKEISNAEHPEPLDKVKVNEEGKMTLDEGLFESLSEDEHDVFAAKNKATEALNHLIQAIDVLEEISKSNLSEEASKKFRDVMFDAAQVADRVSYMRRNLKESFDDEHLGHGDDVCPKCGKDPCECVVNESYLRESSHIIPKEFKRKVLIVEDEASIECVLSTVINTTSNTLNGGSEERSVGFRTITDSIPASFAVSFFDEDKQKEFYESVPKKFDSVKQFIDYLVDIYNSYPRTSAPYNIRNIAKDLGYNDEIETLEECVHSEIEEGEEEKRVYRVTYKHSPEVFSSVMVRAANEDEAKQKLAVKKPGKDIVGVSVMSDDEVNDMTNRGMSLMEAKVVDDFSSYEPWDAAVSTFDNIQNAGKMDALEQLIDDMYPDGIDRTELNDLLAFESDWVYSMLDMSNEGDIDEEEQEDGPAIDFEEEE